MRCLTVVGVALALCALPEFAAGASIEGTNGRDTLRGSQQADVIVARGGDDVLSGGRGDDRLYAGVGLDILAGGQGQDALYGGLGRDRLAGDSGHDLARGGANDDFVGGGVGADRLEGGPGADRLAGGPGPDTLVGGPGDDELTGGAGADWIICGDGEDIANADDGDTVDDSCEPGSREDEDEDEVSWGDTAETAAFVALVVVSLLLAAWGTRRALKWRRRSAVRPSDDDPVALAEWLPGMLPFPVLGIAGIVTYSLYIGDASALAVGVLVAGGVFLTGSLFGFLFGIPKSLTAEGWTGPFKTNTNLEEISDWLTKIIVGLTLIQLGALIDHVADFTEFLEPALGGEESAQGYALAILVLFGINGFLIAYVATRLYAERGFARGRARAEKAVAQLDNPELPRMRENFVVTEALKHLTQGLPDKSNSFVGETRGLSTPSS